MNLLYMSQFFGYKCIYIISHCILKIYTFPFWVSFCWDYLKLGCLNKRDKKSTSMWN